MAPRPDAGLEVALEQRRRTLEETQQVLSARERTLHDQARLLGVAQARVQMVLKQIDAAQHPRPGVPLPVSVLSDLERLLGWCEHQVVLQRQAFEAARAVADEARGFVATAHQQVRALELVLEARAAERATRVHRAELRDADETAARVHSSNVLARKV